jgi:glycosyltransferase involved in cell wall biosynthesis
MTQRRIGYMIPEFPGQTHIWMWREIEWMKRWGVPLQIYSTRRPPERDRARHAWADDAATQTVYVWPRPATEVLAAAAWAMLTRPLGLLRAVRLALTLPVETGGQRKRPKLWQLLPPACVLARDAARRRIEHLHAHTCSNAAVLCMMVRRLNGTPFSMTLNANINWWGGAMKEKFEDAEFTVAITRWLLAEMQRDYPTLRPEQRLLGRIGVDTAKWTPTPRPPRDPSAPLSLFTLGRLHVSKGHAVLLRALAKLRDRGVAATLRVAGDGPERPAIETLVAELDLAGSVTLLGSLSEDRCLEEMRRSDAFVLASDAEPLGVVYMEAMSAGVATVGTDAGGVGEIITNGRDGLLVPPRNPDALADALQRLATDEPLRQRLGAAGRETIVSRFDARLGAATLYERLHGTPPPTPPA